MSIVLCPFYRWINESALLLLTMALLMSSFSAEFQLSAASAFTLCALLVLSTWPGMQRGPCECSPGEGMLTTIGHRDDGWP